MLGFISGVTFNKPTKTKKNPRVSDNAVSGNDLIIFVFINLVLLKLTLNCVLISDFELIMHTNVCIIHNRV